MLKIIVRTDDASMAANVGGSVLTTLRSFDANLPELEAFLRETEAPRLQYTQRQVIGVELTATPITEGSTNAGE